MFKISKFLDSEKENIEIFPIELEINNKKVNSLLIEVNGYINDDEYTFRFILSDINKIFKIKVNEEACLDDDYLLLDETMFTYNGVTDLDTMCDIDVFRIDDNNFEFNINFNTSEYNGLISFDCNLKKYLWYFFIFLEDNKVGLIILDVTLSDVNDNTVTVYMKRIREKLDSDIIITLKGMGYRIDEK